MSTAVNDIASKNPAPVKERDDVNANVNGSFFLNDIVAFTKTAFSVASDSVTVGLRTAVKGSGGKDKTRDASGNYLVNDDSQVSPAETPAEEVPGYEGAMRIDEEIQVLLFKAEHSNLTPKEWKDLLAWLCSIGLEDVAKALEENPESATEIMDILNDPQGYLDHIKAQAEYDASSDGREAIARTLIGFFLPKGVKPVVPLTEEEQNDLAMTVLQRKYPGASPSDKEAPRDVISLFSLGGSGDSSGRVALAGAYDKKGNYYIIAVNEDESVDIIEFKKTDGGYSLGKTESTTVNKLVKDKVITKAEAKGLRPQVEPQEDYSESSGHWVEGGEEMTTYYDADGDGYAESAVTSIDYSTKYSPGRVSYSFVDKKGHKWEITILEDGSVTLTEYKKSGNTDDDIWIANVNQEQTTLDQLVKEDKLTREQADALMWADEETLEKDFKEADYKRLGLPKNFDPERAAARDEALYGQARWNAANKLWPPDCKLEGGGSEVNDKGERCYNLFGTDKNGKGRMVRIYENGKVEYVSYETGDYPDGAKVYKTTTLKKLVEKGELTQKEADCFQGFGTWRSKMWLKSDGDYLKTDPEYLALIKEISLLLNVLSLLFMLAEGRIKAKELIMEAATGMKLEKGKFSLMESAENYRSNIMKMMNYQRDSLERYVSVHNNRVKQGKLNEAQKEAEEEANNNGWNWFSEIASFGTSGAIDLDTKRRYEKKAAAIEREYQAFQERTEKEYEKAVLQDSSYYDTGDPFGVQIGREMGRINSGYFTIEGDGWLSKNNLNSDAVVASREKIIGLENTRRLWYQLQIAKEKLKEAVFAAATGLDAGNDNGGAIIASLNEVSQMEQAVFANTVSRLQGIITAHNSAVEHEYDALYYQFKLWSACWTSIGPLAPLLKLYPDALIDGIFSELEPTVDFDESDLHLGEKLNELVERHNRARTEVGRRIIENDQEMARRVEELERQEWEKINALSGPALIRQDGNDLWTLDEATVSKLRDELVRLQNLQRLIILLQNARYHLKGMIAKVVSGRGGSGLEALGSETLDPAFDTRTLAFELKLANLTNRIKDHNQLRLDKLRAIQSLYKLTGGALFAAIAIVIAGLVPGVGPVLAVGFVVALGSLGSALGNIAYNSKYDVDPLSGSDDFYDQQRLANDMVDNCVSNLNDRAEATIDRITADTHRDLGGGQWGLDAAVFMDVSNELNRIQILQKIIIMLAQANQDLSNVVLATIAGVSAGDNSGLLGSAVNAVHRSQTAALDLKKEMLQDVIGAHNREVAQDKEMHRAYIQAGISAASIIAGGAGALAPGGLNIIEGVKRGLEIGGYFQVAANLTFAIMDASGDNQALGDKSEINAIIDDIYQTNRSTVASTLQRAERAAVVSASGELVVDIGAGNMAIDSAAFARLSTKIDSIYNAYILQATMSQGRNQLKRVIARTLGMVAGRDSNAALEAIYMAKAAATRNIDTLRSRLENHVDRSNQLNEAAKNLYMQIAAATVTAVNIVLNEFTKNGEKLDDAVKKLNSNKTTITIVDAQKHPVLTQLLPYISGTDGKLGLADLAGMTKSVLLSEEFWSLLASEVYDATATAKTGPRPPVCEPNRSAGSGPIDYYDRKAEAEAVTQGKLETKNEREANILRLDSALRHSLFGVGKAAQSGIGLVRRLPSDPKEAVALIEKLIQEKQNRLAEIEKALGQKIVGKNAAKNQRSLERQKKELTQELKELEGIRQQFVSQLPPAPLAPAAAAANQPTQPNKTPVAAAVAAAAPAVAQAIRETLPPVAKGVSAPAAAEAPNTSNLVAFADNALKEQDQTIEISALQVKQLAERTRTASGRLAEGEGLDPEVAASLSGLKKPLLQLTTALKARLKVSDPKLAEQLDAEIKGTLSPRSPQLTSASAQRVLDLIKKIVEQDSKLSRTVKENIAAAIISLGQTSDNEKLLPLIKEKLLAPIDRQEAPDQIAPKLIRALNHEGLSGDQLVEAVQNNLEKITAGFKGDQDKLAKLDAVLQEVARLTPNSPRTQRLVKEVSAVLAKKRSRPDDNGQTPASAPGSDRPAAPVITAFAPADNDPQRNIANLQARVNELLRQIAAAQAPDPAAEVEPPANVTLEQLTNEVLRLDGELAAKKAALQNLAAKELPALQQQYNELKLKVLNNTVTPQELKKLNDRIQMTEGAIKALEQEVGPLAARLRQLRGQIAALALIEEKKKKERAALDRPDTASPALFGDGQYAGLSAHNELLKIKKKQNNCAPVA